MAKFALNSLRGYIHMATAHRPIGRRLTLLASSSAGAMALMVAVGGGAALAPASARAMDECGVQSGSAPVVCPAGVYPSGISYNGNPDFNLVLQDGVDVPDNGVTVLSFSGGDINVTASAATPGIGDINLNSLDGEALALRTFGGPGDVTLDLTDADHGDAPGQINGYYRGVYASSDAGSVSLNFDDVAVTSSWESGDAIVGSARNAVTIRTAAPVTGGLRGIGGGSFGPVNITTTRTAPVTAMFGRDFGGLEGIGIWGLGGPVTITADGDVGSFEVPFTRAIFAASGWHSDGDVNITSNGDIYASETAIWVENASSSRGDVEVNYGVSRPATMTSMSEGIEASILWGSNPGAIDVTVGDDSMIHASVGVYARTAGSGDIAVRLGSRVTMDYPGAGIYVTAKTGAIDIQMGAGSTIAGRSEAIFARGSGAITVSSAGGITSIEMGIEGLGVDGPLSLSSSGSVTAGLVGIRGTALGSGSVTVANGGSVQGGDAAIDASTLSGRLDVASTGSLSGDVGVRAVSQDGPVAVKATGSVTAAGVGIDARALGAGPLTVEAGGVQAGGAGVLATTNSSNVLVYASGDISSGAAAAIAVNSGGAARVDVGSSATVSSETPALSIAAAGALTINNSGKIRSTSGSAGDIVIDVDVASATLNNTGTLQGAVDFTDADSLAFTNSGVWRTAGTSVFTAGGDTLTSSGAIVTSGATTIDFGAGSDSFTNSGRLAAGQGGASTLTLANLETFNNAELILFGSNDRMTTDGEANDRLVAHGTAFTGSDGGTLAMDVDLGGATQANCSAATVADCFDLTGGSTGGSTMIRVADAGQSPGVLNSGGIVLVDVHDGASAAGDFALDPTSAGYTVDSTLGGGIEKGLFLYQLDYGSANQQHRLVSLPSSRAFEFAPLAASAQSVWYTSIGSWFDRQADLRDTLAAGDTGPGVWIKMAGANDNRDAATAYGPYEFNVSNKQDTFAALAGIDLLHGASDGQGFVVGLSAGQLNSDIQFKASHRSAKLEGQSYGAYGSWLSNSFFLDAIVQQNDLDLTDHTIMGAKGKVKSTGGQVEGGWRMPFGMVSVEPLASLAYVRTKFDDLALPGATLHTEEAKSLRGSLGVRLTGDTDLHSATLRWQTTARVWDEFEGKNRAVLTSNGQAIGMPDDVSGAFGDVGVGVSLYSPSAHVSTFLNTGMKFKSDYHSTNTAIGFRVQW